MRPKDSEEVMHRSPRILVFRNGSIGNTLAAVPALKCLRSSFPDSRIEIVLDSIGKELLLNCPYFDAVHVYDRKRDHYGIGGFLAFAFSLRQFKPDIAILLKRFKRNGLLAFLSGAKIRAGFETNGKAPFLTTTIPYDESVHVSELNMRLVESLGADAIEGTKPEVFLSGNELKEAQVWLANHGVSGRFIVAHFGGVTTGAGFVSELIRAELLSRLADNSPIVLIGNGVRETAEATALSKQLTNCVVACDLPLRTMMAIVSCCSQFIGTNSGPMHIAAALQKDGLALFAKNDRYSAEIVKWRPQHDGLRVIPISSESRLEDVLSDAQKLWKKS